MSTVKEVISVQEKFAELYEEYMPKIYRYIRYKVNNTQLAEDLTSTTFEKALVNFDKYCSDKASFSTWLFSIARNIVIDHYRVVGRRRVVPLEEATGVPMSDLSPDEMVEQSEEMAMLHSCLVKLPHADQEIIRLKFAAELNNRQIAKMLGLSETNVGSRLYRAVKKLRDSFEV